MGEPPSSSRDEANREKRNVAFRSLIAALVLALLKAVVGLATGSLGILAEATHSALDMVAAGITLWAVRISGQPADREHTYGHGKFENLSALFETLLLLAACAWIIYEAASRLFFEEAFRVEATIWAFLVIIVSIAVDYSRSRALHRAARRHGSQALEADALHFSTDIWSSAVVLLGLCGVLAADNLQVPWLAKADSVAALGVALIIIWVSLRLGRKSVDDLLDRAPSELRQKVAAAAAEVPGVVDVKQIRVRRSGPAVFTDVTLTVDRAAAFEGAHQIANQTEAAIRRALPQADVVVHVEPVAGGREDATTTIRVLAARHRLAAHSVRIYEENGQSSLELHLEVDESLDLKEAHRQATQFERSLRESLPGLSRIVTHIEPAGDAASTVQAESAGEHVVLALRATQIHEALREFIRTSDLAVQPHDVKVQWVDAQLAVSFHCTLDAATTVIDAHELTERLETFLRSRVPNLGRVVIHVEPSKLGEQPQSGK